MNTTEGKDEKGISSKALFEVTRSENEVIRISGGLYKGVSYVDIRVFYKDGESGEYRPTKKGVTFKQELLGKVIEGLLEVEERIEKGL